MAQDPEYKRCLRASVLGDHECQADPATGRLIEWEHAIIYAGKQLQEKWAIIPICWHTHRGPGLNKRINEMLALNRATDEDLKKISKSTDYIHLRKYLNKKYRD